MTHTSPGAAPAPHGIAAFRWPRLLAACAALLLLVPAGLRADSPAPADDRDRPERPTLDDLLDLPTPDRPDADDDDADDRPGTFDPDVIRLDEAGRADPFRSAVADMKLVAEKLGLERDTGLDTQRVQESIIRRLDQLIEQLENQEPSGSPQQAGEPDSGAEPEPMEGEGQDQGDERASQAAQDERATHGSAREGELGDGPLAEALAEWGNLPPRLRDQLLQGMEDRFSSLYDELTERYYRRLAEEAD